MKIHFSSRLWLAWQVFRGHIVAATWDSTGKITLDFRRDDNFTAHVKEYF